MITSAEILARPYAEAVFKIAKTNEALPAWGLFFAATNLLFKSPKILRLLKSPINLPASKFSLIATLLGDTFTLPMQNFVKLLLENKRLLLLPEIAKQFHLLQEKAANIVEGHVSSAYPLSAESLAALVTALEARTGQKVVLKHHLDKTLLGGLYLRLGDEVIDGSILGKLKQLAHHLQLKESVCL